MLDEDSLVVTYNDWRGEPRSPHRKKLEAQGIAAGDCVDCNACVAVCPMGIDIRDGQQLACITCALCIDACDGVMEKIGKPSGLISYSTLEVYSARIAGMAAKMGWRTFVRPRTILYASVWAAISIVMLVALGTRERLDINVVPDRNPLYVTLSDGSIRNGYTIKILNMEQRPRAFIVGLDGLPGAEMTMAESTMGPARSVSVDVEPDKVRSMKVYVTAPAQSLAGESTPFSFTLADTAANGEATTREAIFQGPKE
jgi:cytochrome c oxidase accessory protein FixG